MHKAESVLENEIHKILWNFEIQTDHLILTRQPDPVIVNKKEKKNLLNSELCHSSRPQNEHQRKQKERQAFTPCQKTKKAVVHEGNSDTNWNLCTWNNPKSLAKGAGRVGNRRTSQDHLNYSIVKITQNTEKSPGDLRRLAVIQIPVKDHQLMLLWKTCNEYQ